LVPLDLVRRRGHGRGTTMACGDGASTHPPPADDARCRSGADGGRAPGYGSRRWSTTTTCGTSTATSSTRPSSLAPLERFSPPPSHGPGLLRLPPSQVPLSSMSAFGAVGSFAVDGRRVSAGFNNHCRGCSMTTPPLLGFGRLQ
jgi:hypothetical protein